MPKVTYTCPNCKQEFVDREYRTRIGKAPCCSKECEQAIRYIESRAAKAQEIRKYKAGLSNIVPWMIRRYYRQLKRYGYQI